MYFSFLCVLQRNEKYQKKETDQRGFSQSRPFGNPPKIERRCVNTDSKSNGLYDYVRALLVRTSLAALGSTVTELQRREDL